MGGGIIENEWRGGKRTSRIQVDMKKQGEEERRGKKGKGVKQKEKRK